MRGPDPIEDFNRHDAEEAAYEMLCPVCDICGERIVDDYYYQIGDMIFHLDCADRHSVDSYMEEEARRNGIEI